MLLDPTIFIYFPVFSQERFQAEAAAADRAARMSSSNAALAASAESEAAREWKRQAAEARRAEAKAMASQQRAEVAAQNARKEIGQKDQNCRLNPLNPLNRKKRRRDEFKEDGWIFWLKCFLFREWWG